jgi:lysophospholipase L1-like esterase
MYRILLAVVALVCSVPSALAQVANNPVRVVLPPDVYAVVGHEMNVYFDNIILVPNIDSVLFDVECATGRQDQQRWRFTPAAEDVGDHALSIKVVDGTNSVLAEASTTVHVLPADAGAGTPFSLLCVGDSLTHASVYPQELWELFGEQLRLIGTHHPSDSLPPEVVHEGYGGWRWETFCTRWTEGDDPRARSPFLRLVDGQPTLDFQHYCDANNNGEGPDFITVLLGCNDTFGATEETIEEAIDRMFGYADMLLAEFCKVRPDTQIGLLLLPPPAASQDAFGSNYQCGQTRWQYRRNQHRVVERMMEKFAGREEENIRLLPAHVNLDTVHNYPTKAEPANARSDAEIARQSNGVHPSSAGYRQIADTIHAWLRYRLAQG